MSEISIITPALNSAETIRDCIESVLSQSIAIEHIIIDGGSTDDSLKIIDGYSAKIAKVLSEPDQGIYDALNKGLMLATGDVIGILHADDFFETPRTLEKVAGLLEKDRTDSCYGDLLYVDYTKTSKIVRYWRSGQFSISRFYQGWMPPHPTFFARRSVYEKYGGFNLDLGTAADYELMLRFLLRYRISTSYLPEIITRMRVGGMSNASIANRIRANRNDRMAWRINGLTPYPWTLWIKPLRKIIQYLKKPILGDV